jgi:hypothetical protein
MEQTEQDARLQQELTRSQQAQDLIDHPLMKEAFETIRQTYLKEWENSPARDSEAREKIWTYLKQLEAVKGHLLQTIETGKMARIEVERKSLLQRTMDGVTGFRR